MISDYSCPVCGSDSWKSVQKYIYHAKDRPVFSFSYRDKCINFFNRIRHLFNVLLFSAPLPKTVSINRITDYEFLRRQVLFDIWFPAEKTITLTSCYCTQCGFMAYSPRPNENDLEKKYAFLTGQTTSEDAHSHVAFLESDSYSKRNRDEIFRLISTEISSGNFRILDFGGGIGWYLKPFLEHGHECMLIDFDTEQLPGIHKIADVITDIPPDFKCDVVISRATLEHVADPLSILKAFHEILNDKGVVYALVPEEIFGGINRLGSDPVTHINFFTSDSFNYLFKLAGFDIVLSGIDEIRNIRVLARKTELSDYNVPVPGCSATEQLLYPGRIYSLKRIIRDKFHLIYRRFSILP
ncbi:class I SAM-dependent methyltransferase [Candidatus Latescibacterota bacterium]